MKNNLFVFIAFFFCVVPSTAQQLERTDSSIVQVVYPQRDLKLWYGSDAFRVDNFVVLPNYTILHSRETSTIRLLDNREMLVLDDFKLLSIRTIRPHDLAGEDIAIGPLTPWFTIVNDSTVLAGTAPFKGKRNSSGYVELAIRRNKLAVVHKPYPLEEGIESGDVSPVKTQFINNFIEYGNGKLMASWMPLKGKLDGEKTVVKGIVYKKNDNDPVSILYETEKPIVDTVDQRKKMVNAIQLLLTDGQLFIYDSEREELRTATTDLTKLTLIDVAKVLLAKLPEGRRLGRLFMYDRVTNQLYYRASYFRGSVSNQLYMKASLSGNSLTLTPFLQGDLTGYYSTYINNRRLFFHDTKRGFIYVTQTDAP